MKVWVVLREDYDCTSDIKAICATEKRAEEALEEEVATWDPPFQETARAKLFIQEREVLS